MKIKKIVLSGFFLGLMTLTLYLSYSLNIKELPDPFIHLITTKFDSLNKREYKIDFINLYINTLKRTNKHFKEKKKIEVEEVSKVLYNTEEPLVYIYNTHSNEEYSYTKNDIYNITPNVKTASYILEDELKKLGIHSVVETENTIEILNSKKMNYSESYKISRTLLENKAREYPSLAYFIDVHRDSVNGNITTATINGVKYAKIMFLLGLENEKYSENKKIMIEMNTYLNENYPGLSRGIYEKKGVGVNGVYNQDFSPNVFLIEVGGVENTIEEVSNSLKIVANAFYNYLNNHKTTKK